jgi:Type I phosphodiesterase / nucleotide pyrophosphatase
MCSPPRNTRLGAAAEAFLFLAVTIGVCAILTVVFFSHRSPKSLTPLAAHGSPLTQKVLLIVVDALRADTAFDPARMPHVVAMASRGASGVALATPLTMSIPGIRAIGCGTTSDYLDLFENWGAPVTDKPNLLANLKGADISTGIIGDDGWESVYRPWLDVIQTRTGLGGFEYYIHAMEKPDRIHLDRARSALQKGIAPRFLVVHFVGLDHAGHAFGPQSDRYAVAARAMDEKIDGLIRSVDTDTTVLITSDHAMTNRGGHGGSDAEARQSPIVMSGRGIRQISGLAVDQVDLASTMAVLFGVPIPAQSIGRIIHEALDISDQQREELLVQNQDQLLHLLKATYPSHWERRLDDARKRARLSGFSQSDGPHLSAISRQAMETIEAIRQTIDKRDWEDRLPVVVWLVVGLLLCTWLWSSLRQSGEPTSAWITVSAAASILVAAFIGLSRPETRLALSLCACAAMLGVILYSRRNTLRLRALGNPLLAALAVTLLCSLVVYGRIRQYRSDTMFGSMNDSVAGLLGWGFFLVGATLGTLLRNRWPAAHHLRHWGGSAMGVVLFCLMGFGGRPLALASFGSLALLTCIWHFGRTPWSAGTGPGEKLSSRLRPHLKVGVSLLLLGLATLLAVYSKSYYLLGFVRWKNPVFGVRVAAALFSCALLLFLWLLHRKTRGVPTLTDRGLSLLAGSAALGAVLSQVWPTHRLINSVLLLSGLSLAALAWLGRRRPVWILVLLSLVSAWIVMSDPKGAIAIALITAYLVLLVPSMHLPDSRLVWLVAIGLWIMAVRVALVVLLEGSFNFDSFEIATALMGNPGHAPLQGGLRVFLKFALPVFVLAAILSHALSYQRLVSAMRVALFLIVARIIHLTAGILATSGQFYTPYRLAEELSYYLAFSLTFSICLLLLLLVAGFAGRSPEADRP